MPEDNTLLEAHKFLIDYVSMLRTIAPQFGRDKYMSELHETIKALGFLID